MASPNLQLVKSFDLSAYPHRVLIDMSVQPDKVALDGLCKKLPRYTAFKETTYLEQRMRQILSILERGGVDDYTLLRSGNKLQLFFKDADDRPILIAGLHPNAAYGTDFVVCPEGYSNGALRRKAAEYRNLFNAVGLGETVSFTIDKERKTVRVTAGNGNDFVSFWGKVRSIEKQNNFRFQALFG